ASSAVNLITKSGTNNFHGSASEFIRDYHFNARNFFALSRDSLRRNQCGGNLGGPLVKNNAFFFGSYQGEFEHTHPTTTLSFVPTQATRHGGFTAFASPTCNVGRQITLSAPFVNNTIDPSRLNPVAVSFLKYVPVSTDPCGRLQYGIPNNNTESEALGKVDYNLSTKQTMFVRYLYA